MIKLLKYDWKRNSTLLIAAAVVLVLAQIVLSAIGARNEWNGHWVYLGTMIMYALAAFLAFLAACITYHINLKAYSRRLLPVPAVYTAATPLLFFFTGQLALGAMFIVYDRVMAYANGWSDSFASLMLKELEFSALFNLMLGSIWGWVVAMLIIQFGITLAHTIASKLGAWLGLAAVVLLFLAIPWLSDLLVPTPYLIYTESMMKVLQLFGIEELLFGSGEAELTSVIKLNTWQTFLFEAIIIGGLFYGIVYMLRNKVKV